MTDQDLQRMSHLSHLVRHGKGIWQVFAWDIAALAAACGLGVCPSRRGRREDKDSRSETHPFLKRRYMAGEASGRCGDAAQPTCLRITAVPHSGQTPLVLPVRSYP